MAWIDDIDLLNNAATSGNWTASGFDSPTLNDSAATTPIYLEGSACMWWPLKKGTTNGYTYTSTIGGTPTLTGRIVVGFLNYPFADIDLIPITSMFMRLSSSTGFTTNYLQWDASAQVLSPENIPISGHTPVIGYADAGTETGTFNGNCESVGWVATTGNDADGKQGGYDWFFVASWVGAHSATYTQTYFSGLYDEYYDNEGAGLPGQTSRPIGVLSKSGDFYQTNLSFQLGDGTADTANLVVTETAKTIFFNNLHVNHELGYIFVDPASTNTISFTITNCVHFWNDQASGSEVFTDASNAAIFKVSGCSFSRGGDVNLPPYDTDSTTFIENSSFDSCGAVDIGDITFTGNTVSGAAVGVEYVGSGTRRSSGNAYNSNTVALHFDTAQTVTIDGDSFSGNTYDVENASSATNADSYSETNQDQATGLNGSPDAAGQSFTGNGGVLSKVRLYLQKVGSPTGNITVSIYAHSGTFGTSSVGTGSPIATSEVVSAADVSASYSLITFEFKDELTLVNSTNYVLMCAYAGDVTNYIRVGRDNSTPGHGGNFIHLAATTWTPFSNIDGCFYVDTGGILKLNATNGANPATATNTGTLPGVTIIANAVTVEVKTITSASVNIQDVRVRIVDSGDNEIINGLTDVNGEISASYNYAGDESITGWCRKATTSPLYKQGDVTGTITSAGFSVTVTMILDE